MTLGGWILVGLAGAALMGVASRIALREVIALSERVGIPKFLVGLTVVALGTDLPEIVNSIVASYMGHGDVNLGDSIGSVLTQGTLVLGLVPFVVPRALAVRSGEVATLGALTVVLLVLGAGVARDGHLSRGDGLALVVAGVAALAFAVRRHGVGDAGPQAEVQAHHALRHAAIGLAALVGVGIGATAVVRAVVASAVALGAPEYALSFFAASLGTSLPELVVNLIAARRGQRELALGGVLGACLLDASVSAGIGPLLFPTPVTASSAALGALVAGAGLTVAAVALATRRRHDRASGAALLVAYFAAYAMLLGFG